MSTNTISQEQETQSEQVEETQSEQVQETQEVVEIPKLKEEVLKTKEVLLKEKEETTETKEETTETKEDSSKPKKKTLSQDEKLQERIKNHTDKVGAFLNAENAMSQKRIHLICKYDTYEEMPDEKKKELYLLTNRLLRVKEQLTTYANEALLHVQKSNKLLVKENNALLAKLALIENSLI